MKIATDPDGTTRIAGLGEMERVFPLLRVADLSALQQTMPLEARDRLLVSVFDLSRYAQSSDGADQVLLASMRKSDPAVTLDHVRAVGSILHRVQIARAVMGEALTYGGSKP